MSLKHHTRRKRRQARAAQRFGRAAAPRHVGLSGRTGHMHSRKTPANRRDPYVGAPPRSIADAARCVKCGAGPGEIHDHSHKEAA